jgi:hypothetical protein
MAADWLDGAAMVVPTMKLAAEMFGVSYPLITSMRQDRGWAPVPMPLGLLTLGWMHATDAERAAFASKFEAEVWRALEHVDVHFGGVPALQAAE